jgi:hypothetical protein
MLGIHHAKLGTTLSGVQPRVAVARCNSGMAHRGDHRGSPAVDFHRGSAIRTSALSPDASYFSAVHAAPRETAAAFCVDQSGCLRGQLVWQRYACTTHRCDGSLRQPYDPHGTRQSIGVNGSVAARGVLSAHSHNYQRFTRQKNDTQIPASSPATAATV